MITLEQIIDFHNYKNSYASLMYTLVVHFEIEKSICYDVLHVLSRGLLRRHSIYMDVSTCLLGGRARPTVLITPYFLLTTSGPLSGGQHKGYRDV